MECRMSIEKTEAAIEAILFTMGESVEAEKIAVAIEHDVDTTVKIIHNMMDKYENEDRGIKIIELEGSFQLCTKEEYYDNLIRICSQPRRYTLTDAALETLSIIAYKQPVTKIEIEKIRGVNSDRSVNKLVELELVKEVGRLDAPGRPMLFGTTEGCITGKSAYNSKLYIKYSIDELPVISEDMVEQYKEEAEYEIASELKEEAMNEEQLTLDI